MDDRLTCLLERGENPADSVLQPALDWDGSIVPEPDEAVIWHGQFKVSIDFFNRAAGVLGNKEQWESALELDSRAVTAITNRRVHFVWPKWKKNTGVMTRLAARDLVLAGQVRGPWVKTLYVGKPKGLLAKASRLRFDVQDGEIDFAVTVDGLDPTAVTAVARQFLAAVAGERLQRVSELNDEARPALTALAAGDDSLYALGWPRDVGWAEQFWVPAALKIGYVD